MAQNTNNTHRLEIGKEIDWTKIHPSVTRAVWEPPALEVLDLFEGIETAVLKRSVTNSWKRAQLLDLYGEFLISCRYFVWICQTGDADKHDGNWTKVDWYLQLFSAVYEDSKVVYIELF